MPDSTMNQEQLLSNEAATRSEATAILQLTQLETELSQFGETHLIGSYTYNVMVERDIDFHVIV